MKEVYDRTMRFVIKEVAEFYLEFSKYRRRRLQSQASREGGLSPDIQSMLQTVQQLFMTLLQTSAPIMPFSA